MNSKFSENPPIELLNKSEQIQHNQCMDLFLETSLHIGKLNSIEEIFTSLIIALNNKFSSLEIQILYFINNDWQLYNQHGLLTCESSKTQIQLISAHLKKINEDFISTQQKTGRVTIPVKSGTKIIYYMSLEQQGDKESVYSHELIRHLKALSNIAVNSAENIRISQEILSKSIEQNEIEMAATIQKELIPYDFPNTDEWMFNSVYIPQQQIGGDSFDIIKHPSEEAIYIAVADVSGKGISAAFLMANFHATLKTLVQYEDDYEEFANYLNHAIFDITKGERFISLFLAVINKSTKDIRYINFGHNPPLLKTDGKITPLTQGSTILGAFEQLPFLSVGQENWDENSQLLAFTDGLVDAHNSFEERFGEQRVIDLFAQKDYTQPDELNSTLLEKVMEFTKPNTFNDDITMLSIFQRK